MKILHRIAVIALLVGALAGCTSTPRHTNTLIFGTTSKVALDVSQDPTGSLGVTIGYRRQEAVWLPLLPNQSADGTPAKCDDRDRCPLLTASAKEATEQKTDTYSVLASFGADVGGDASAGRGGVKIAQYFATGIAAQNLAARGGAALVNTQAAEVTPEEVARIRKQVDDDRVKVGRIITTVEDKSKAGQVDPQAIEKLLTASTLSTDDKDSVRQQAKSGVDRLRNYLMKLRPDLIAPLDPAARSTS